MKMRMLLKIILVIAFILSAISLAFHHDATLIIAAVLMGICVIISFVKKR